MEDFNITVQGLIELDSIGATSHEKNVVGTSHKFMKLDQAFGNISCITRWTQVHPRLLFGNSSDHAVKYIELLASEKGPKPFKFYNSLPWDPNFNDIFISTWVVGIENTPNFRLHQKIKFEACSMVMGSEQWEQCQTLSSYDNEIKKLEEEL